MGVVFYSCYYWGKIVCIACAKIASFSACNNYDAGGCMDTMWAFCWVTLLWCLCVSVYCKDKKGECVSDMRLIFIRSRMWVAFSCAQYFGCFTMQIGECECDMWHDGEGCDIDCPPECNWAGPPWNGEVHPGVECVKAENPHLGQLSGKKKRERERERECKQGTETP